MEGLGLITVITTIIQSGIAALVTLIPVMLSTASSRNEFRKKLDVNIRSTSLLLMHDEHLSLESRIAAGDDFIAAGGNGTGRAFRQELIRQYDELLKARGTE
jgi:hypothetical protein